MSIALAAQDLAQHLRQGEAAIFPTDTLPALASRPEHAAQLWNLKERPQHKPLILMGACANDLWQWLGRKPLASWTQLADQYWPGALTLVVPAAPELVNPLHPGGDSIGLRVPACDVALALLRASGPLATTSANRSGEDPCLNPQEAAKRFPNVAQLAPQPWPHPSGKASTVLRWIDGDGWRMLRRGAVVPAEVKDESC